MDIDFSKNTDGLIPAINSRQRNLNAVSENGGYIDRACLKKNRVGL
jgi:hypothetical protein